MISYYVLTRLIDSHLDLALAKEDAKSHLEFGRALQASKLPGSANGCVGNDGYIIKVAIYRRELLMIFSCNQGFP